MDYGWRARRLIKSQGGLCVHYNHWNKCVAQATIFLFFFVLINFCLQLYKYSSFIWRQTGRISLIFFRFVIYLFAIIKFHNMSFSYSLDRNATGTSYLVFLPKSLLFLKFRSTRIVLPHFFFAYSLLFLI